MGQRGERAAHPVNLVQIEVGEEIAGSLVPFRDDPSPGIGNQGVTVGGSPFTVPAALRRGEQEALVFQRPGTRQQVPVIAPGAIGEGGRREEDPGSAA